MAYTCNYKYLEIPNLIIECIISPERMELRIYTILHGYIAVQGTSVDTVFNGLLAEIPAILDSFFHQYHKHTCTGVVGGGLGR